MPLRISVVDANDNEPYFIGQMSRTIPEDSRQFEPRFFVKAKDLDATAVISYRILDPTSSYFHIDENTGELLILSDTLPPNNYSFVVEAFDGLFTAQTPVAVTVTDINNHHPAFSDETLGQRILDIPEDIPIGSVVAKVEASDADLGNNGRVHYSIDKGAYGFFEIDDLSGEIKLLKHLDDDVVPHFDLLVTAFDEGLPSMRTSTVIQIQVDNIYLPLPKITPTVQRAQVSESAPVGTVVATIQTDTNTLNSEEDLDLKFQFVNPTEARDADNKVVQNFTATQVSVHICSLFQFL